MINGVWSNVFLGMYSVLLCFCCSDGLALSKEDQKFIVDKVLHYHPDRASKVSGEIEYVMVCFFIESSSLS